MAKSPLIDALCAWNTRFEFLKKEVRRDLENLDPGSLKRLAQILKTSPDPRNVATSLVKYIESFCGSPKKRVTPKLQNLYLMMGSIQLVSGPSNEWKQMETSMAAVSQQIEEAGTFLVKDFMKIVLESAGVYPRTVSKLLSAFSTLCIQNIKHDKLCHLTAMFICEYISDFDTRKLNSIQHLATARLKFFCDSISPCKQRRTRKSPSIVLRDMIRTSDELTWNQKTHLLNKLGETFVAQDTVQMLASTREEDHEAFWNVYAGL